MSTQPDPVAPLPAPGPVPDMFERIALSLSGGGFRAAAYSIGTLKALYLLGLLDQVHMLSTASGGTITGAYYALRRKSGHAFADIYSDFYGLLEQDQLLPHALARWEVGVRSSGPRYKLIQAFADTYSLDLYGEARLGVFWEKDDSPQRPFHLQSLVFGATELYSGLTFRFQYNAYLPALKGNAREAYAIGNGNVSLPTEYARKLRLGDVVAASSCFPGGFEPMILPDDFFPGATDAQMLTKANRRTSDRVALLDGGIYDNQGIDSLLKANERNSRHVQSVRRTYSPQQAALLEPTTLFLVSDVCGADKDLYQVPAPDATLDTSSTLQQVGTDLLVWSFWLLLAAGLLTYHAPTRFWGGLTLGLALGVFGAFVGLLYARQQLKKILTRIGPTVADWVLPALAALRVRQVRELLTVRGKSTLALLTSVFLRRVRSLNYEQLYHQPDKTKPPYQVISSIIGLLATEHERQQASTRKKPGAGPPKVQDQLAAVYETINTARQMHTTLWWQHDKYRLPAIVASAEITLCYQLLRRYEKNPPPSGTREAEVQRRARLLWETYQQAEPNYVVPVSALAVVQNPTATAQQLLTHSGK